MASVASIRSFGSHAMSISTRLHSPEQRHTPNGMQQSAAQPTPRASGATEMGETKAIDRTRAGPIRAATAFTMS
eukprot:2726027-Prymnesium_polylepis.1